MMASISSLFILLIFALLGFGCRGFCPISLPQNTPWHCKLPRAVSLTAQKIDFAIQTPTKSMPFARLHLGLLKLTALLLKNPFLKFHADKWRLLVTFNEGARSSYMLKHLFDPPIMKMSEFSYIADHFRRKPLLLLGHHVKIPSLEEPFQKPPSKLISDQLFAEQRLAGANPLSLRRVTFSDKIGFNWNKLKTTLNRNFEWESAVAKILNGMPLKTLKERAEEAPLDVFGCPFDFIGSRLDRDRSLFPTNSVTSNTKAIEEGYLYVLYHPLSNDLRTLKDEGDKDPKRKMWKYKSPIALFASVPAKESSDAKLLPVAIQMDHEPASEVYTPKDGDLWTLAKLNVQLTDLESSQIVEHLSKVHLVSEGLCLVLERQLSKQHPLYVIMRYHCRGVLTANTYGGPVLLANNLKLDYLFPYGYVGSNALVAKTAKLIDWRNMKLINNIKQRGVDDTKRLPYYPFRDDGAEIEKVIRRMMRDYVNAYYRRDYDVRRDTEVQKFASEISDRGRNSKVKLRGFPPSIRTKGQLVDTFTQMIWLMTGQHAAVNYPMSDYVTYVPNTPLKLYDSERTPNTTFGPERLPNRAQSSSQASFAVSLASYREDRLFDYGNKLKDSKGREVVSRYFNYLSKVVEPLLDRRNEERLDAGHLTYPYMQPRWVPNGIQT